MSKNSTSLAKPQSSLENGTTPRSRMSTLLLRTTLLLGRPRVRFTFHILQEDTKSNILRKPLCQSLRDLSEVFCSTEETLVRSSRLLTSSNRLSRSFISRLERTQYRFWPKPLPTALQEKTLPELVREEMSRDKQSMFLHSEESTKEFISWPPMLERRPSRTPRILLSVWLMKSS